MALKNRGGQGKVRGGQTAPKSRGGGGFGSGYLPSKRQCPPPPPLQNPDKVAIVITGIYHNHNYQ